MLVLHRMFFLSICKLVGKTFFLPFCFSNCKSPLCNLRLRYGNNKYMFRSWKEKRLRTDKGGYVQSSPTWEEIWQETDRLELQSKFN